MSETQKELGALAIARDGLDRKPVREILKQAMQDNKVITSRRRSGEVFDVYSSDVLINQKQAALELGCSEDTVARHLKAFSLKSDRPNDNKGAIRYRAKDIASVKRDCGLMVPFSTAELRLGIPYADMTNFVDAGLLKAGRHPLRSPRAMYDFDIQTIEDLCQAISGNADKPHFEGKGLTISDVVLRLAERSPTTWLDIANCILSGRLRVWQKKTFRLLANLCVSSPLAVTKALGLSKRAIPLRQTEVFADFGWHKFQVRTLIELDLIPTEFYEADILKMTELYLFSTDVQLLLKERRLPYTKEDAIRWCKTAGIKHVSRDVAREIWRRKDVLSSLDR
ncbi:hypothetical protein [Agrobacterium sp. lyk4-40-TYG-31]|uniref:hypothetical protein n=1 Tax=Agrobacterium sp. lyk4-40-TYG-31 TaxID=3040276 RepID=UPI00254D00C5|nr:hypothetical protein [Agrobacterium sp. lyk4-40-TYG-31]